MCFPNNEMEIEILADGTVKITSGRITGALHMTAERFQQWISTELGGETRRVKRAHAHAHAHADRKVTQDS